MEQATNSARQIKEEIHAFKSGFTVISTEDKCSLCLYAIMNQSFYTFPCSHMFHTECLISETLPLLLPGKCRRVEELLQLVNTPGGAPASTQVPAPDSVSVSSSTGTAMPHTSERQRNMIELDDLVAGECFLCGDMMIASIDEPFIKRNEWESVRSKWL